MHNDKILFGGNREKAIQRDGEKCVKCGMTRAEHRVNFGRDITVDHKDGMGHGVPKHLKNNDLSNLQTLCIVCHASKDNTQNKLTDAQVAEIMKLKGTMTQNVIGAMYNVHPTYIGQLYKGKWRKKVTAQVEGESNV